MAALADPLANAGIDSTQDHPQEIPNAQEPESPYGPRNEKLPDQLVDAIKAAIKTFAAQEQYVRRREVLRDRRNRFYERGYQHVYENSQGGFTQGSAGQTIQINGRPVQCPNYIDDYNIFQPYLRILESILTQNPPGIDFRPVNPCASEDIEAAETAEGYRHMFDRSNSVKGIQTQIVRMFGVSGRTILWTRSEADAQLYGTNEDGSAKQMEVTTVYGTLESRVPLLAKCQKDVLYCFLFDDPDVKQAKTQYPDFAEKIKPNMAGLGESAYERTARMGVLQGTRSQAQLGDAFTHLVVRMHCWLRPASFNDTHADKQIFEENFEEGSPGEEGQTVKDKLTELFPNGCHAVFVGDTYVGSWDESMDDALVIGFPYEGDGMYRLALMDPMVVVQDRFNDNMNAAAEVWDMGWPSTWVNADDVEYDAILDQRADPYAIRQKKARSGQPMEEEFYREPNPELPMTFMNFLELLQGQLPQFILAAPPALFGAAMEDQKTASGYSQARSQAMGQQGLIWAQIQYMFSRMYYQAALCATKNPDHSEEIVVPGGDGQSITVQLARLTKGKFGCYPDEDSSFPESTAAKRATLAQIMEMALASPPISGQLFSSPDNWKIFLQVMGFPEITIPEAEVDIKQQFEIEELLKSAPIPPSPEEKQAAEIAHASARAAAENMGGPPPPPMDPDSLLQPSVPIGKYDFDEWEFEKCKEFMSSDACRRELAQGNQQGVKNVQLHAGLHEKRIAMKAAAMAAMGPPPGSSVPPPEKPKRAGSIRGSENKPGIHAPAAPGAPGAGGPTM